ncbi:MAG: SoxR reducing system RseC family protein [Spirochaetota bacterium]|nr:SoxR reducing system RseC family protein [Spirochaetota bacterium]
MKEIGQVVEINGNKLTLLLDPSSNCGSCNSCSSGGNSKNKSICLDNTINAKLNDLVILSLSPSKGIFISIILYVFPILMLILGYFVGNYFDDESDIHTTESYLAIIFSFIFLLLGLLIIYFFDKLMYRKNKLSPKIVGFYTGQSSDLS